MTKKTPPSLPNASVRDVFISHASEDKDSVASPLAAILIQAGMNVWLDEAELLVGDSLRRKIDSGLASCRYGVVILSKAFFAKEWPQKELDALVAREVDGTKVILPIWHNLTRSEVARYSPLLADRLAASTDIGILGVAAAIHKAVQAAKATTESALEHPRQQDTKKNDGASGARSESRSIGPRSIDQLVLELLDRVNDQAENEMEITGIRTGFFDFDLMTGGLQPGEVYVLAGRPSMGCTTFSLSVSHNIATGEELPVIYFSPRAKSSDLISQLTAASGRINRMSLATGRLADNEWGRLAESIERLAKTALYFDDTPEMTIEHVVKCAEERFLELRGFGLIVIDGVQALLSSERGIPWNQVLEQLWRLARAVNCPLLVSTTLPRSVESRIDKRPIISDLPESDMFEQFASGIVFLYCGDHYNRDSNEPGIVEVILARNRSRPLGTIKLAFLRGIGAMENLIQHTKATAAASNDA